MLFVDQLRKADRTLRALAIVVLAGFALLVAGLWRVQVLNAQRYRETLEDQAVRTVRLPAVRGRILDRNGAALAENRPSYNVDVYVAELSKVFNQHYKQIRPAGRLGRADIEQLERRARFEVVSNVVMQISASLDRPRVLPEKLFAHHYDEQRALPFTVLENLDPSQVARFIERPAGVPGIELEIEARRVYPFHQTAAHLIGTAKNDPSSVEGEDADFHYRLPDLRGVTGIEARFDRELRGRAGAKMMWVNRLGYRQSEKMESAPEPGQNVVLTIDRELQAAAERALTTSSFGVNTRGAAVVLDARNGDVLAMASAPAFDPNPFITGLSLEEWHHLSDPHLRPLINRATQENYQPGSIFKIVVSLAGLEMGTLRPDEVLHNPGFYQLAKRRIDDTAPAGDYNFRRALAQSSNTYFITQGLRPGVLQKIVELGQRLHLGERTDILPRQETRGTFPSHKDVISSAWRDGHTANLSIGQDKIDVTPLQMAVMTAAVANGGKVFWPRLVQRLEPLDPTAGEKAVEFIAGRVRDELGVKPENLQIVREAMIADVEDRNGTGREVWMPGFRIGGKTGTAQIEHGGRIVDHTTWFVSFAPAENPRYAVAVMVESGASGGKTCVPITKQIYQAILKRFPSEKSVKVAGVN